MMSLTFLGIHNFLGPVRQFSIKHVNFDRFAEIPIQNLLPVAHCL